MLVDYITPMGIALSFLCYMLSLPVIYYFSLMVVKSKKHAFSFCVLFSFYYVVFVSNYYFQIAPFYPDFKLFHAMLSDGYYPQNQSDGVVNYYYLTYPLSMLSFGYVEVFMVFVIFFSTLSYALIWRAFDLYSKTRFLAVSSLCFYIYISLVMMYPASLLFLTLPLREWVTLLGFATLLCSMMYFEAGKKNGLTLCVISLFLIILSRPTMVIVLLVAFCLRKLSFWYIVLAGGISVFVGPFLFEAFTGYKFSPEFFAYLRISANETYAESGMVYGVVSWVSYFDIIKDIPLLLAQFILSPLPVLHKLNPFSMMAHLLDSIFVVFVVALALFEAKRFPYYILFFFSLAIIFSLWEYYLGGAVRHRLPLIAMILPIAAFRISSIFRYLSGRGAR